MAQIQRGDRAKFDHLAVNLSQPFNPLAETGQRLAGRGGWHRLVIDDQIDALDQVVGAVAIEELAGASLEEQ